MPFYDTKHVGTDQLGITKVPCRHHSPTVHERPPKRNHEVKEHACCRVAGSLQSSSSLETPSGKMITTLSQLCGANDFFDGGSCTLHLNHTSTIPKNPFGIPGSLKFPAERLQLPCRSSPVSDESSIDQWYCSKQKRDLI